MELLSWIHLRESLREWTLTEILTLFCALLQIQLELFFFLKLLFYFVHYWLLPFSLMSCIFDGIVIFLIPYFVRCLCILQLCEIYGGKSESKSICIDIVIFCAFFMCFHSSIFFLPLPQKTFFCTPPLHPPPPPKKKMMLVPSLLISRCLIILAIISKSTTEDSLFFSTLHLSFSYEWVTFFFCSPSLPDLLFPPITHCANHN